MRAANHPVSISACRTSTKTTFVRVRTYQLPPLPTTARPPFCLLGMGKLERKSHWCMP